jgi:hypothetical protein
MRSAVRKAVRFVLPVATLVALVAARPAAPGLTYRLRMTITPPDMPGMQMAPTVVVGHGAAVAAQARFDIDSVSGTIPLAAGDFILSLDSGRTVTVSPSTKSYTEGMPGVAAMPPELLAQASISNISITTEKLGAGDAIEGFPTEKVRMTTTYTLNIMGQSMNSMNVSEMSLAKLPSAITTPFDGSTMPKELLEGPMKELGEKIVAARKALGNVTALKTVNTSTMSSPMLPQSLSTVISMEMSQVKAGDVDPAILKVPDGFSKKP